MKFEKNVKCDSVLRIRIRDPVLFYPPDPGSGSGIRDGAMVGSGIRDKQTKFVNSLYKKEVGSGIRDPVLFYPPDPGSVIRIRDGAMVGSGSGIKHPGSATLV
jgi:hypothetical protein